MALRKVPVNFADGEVSKGVTVDEDTAAEETVDADAVDIDTGARDVGAVEALLTNPETRKRALDAAKRSFYEKCY